jgi:hypothetical protein
MASPTGFAMASLGGQPITTLSAGSGTVDAHAGMICLMTESGVYSSDAINAPYTIDLLLTDSDSGQSHTFSLTPTKGLTSNVAFPLVGNATATTTTDLPPAVSDVVGSTLYTISADPQKYFSPPGVPEDKGRPGLTGGFILEVSAAPAPEPGLCVVIAALPLLLRRRRGGMA